MWDWEGTEVTAERPWSPGWHEEKPSCLQPGEHKVLAPAVTLMPPVTPASLRNMSLLNSAPVVCVVKAKTLSVRLKSCLKDNPSVKRHFLCLFLLKAGLHFLFQVTCHVYFLIFLHLSKVLHFNLLEWHLIKINPAICLCWQLRDFLSALSFVGRKEKAVTEEAGRAVGGVSAFIRSGWWKWSCFIWERTSWIALVFCTSQELSWAGYSLAIRGAFGAALQWWEKLSLDWVTVSPQRQFNVAWEILSS